MGNPRDPARYKEGLFLTKDNRLVRMQGNMTPTSYKIVNYFLWMAAASGKNDHLQVNATKILNILHIGDRSFGKVLTAECEKAAKTIVTFRSKDDPDNDWITMSLVPVIRYKDGIMTAEVNLSVMPYINELRGNFTPLQLETVNTLETYSSMRLYEVCASWKRAGKVTYTVDEWRGLLGAKKKSYDVFGQFKKRVWNPAVKTVNEHTEFRIKDSFVKQGRKTTHITIYIKEIETVDVSVAEVPFSPQKNSEEPSKTTLGKVPADEPADELQSRYEAAGATPSAVRRWREKYPEDALRWLLGKIKQAKPKDVGAWLGAACRDGGWLMNAYQIEMQEKRERAEKARNTAHFVIPEIPADAVSIPFDLSEALEKALVAVIKQHLQNGELNITAKGALIAHRMQPAEFAERYL